MQIMFKNMIFFLKKKKKKKVFCPFYLSILLFGKKYANTFTV